MSGISNIIWFLVAGLWLAIGHVTTAAAQAVGKNMQADVFVDSDMRVTFGK